MGLDPVRFARAAWGEAPDGWQREALTSSASRQIYLACRQAGKSLTAATLATWTALYTRNALVLLLSPTLRQSGEIFRKAKNVYTEAGRPVPATGETQLTLDLKNGSRIVSLPGSKEGTIRGYSKVALLVVDEAAYVSDDLFASVFPMLAVSGGRMVMLGTPNAKRGFLYQSWVSAENWERFEITADDVPRISEAHVDEARRKYGERHVQQEYYVEFLDSEYQVFERDEVDRLFSEEFEAWQL